MSDTTASAPTLLRAMGKWTLAGLVLNSIIGTGVFVLPGTIAGILGRWSILAWVMAAAITGAMILSFAEVASRFTGAGGAYLYAHSAFGRFAGVQMAWFVYLARCVSGAVQANLFTTYLAEFWAPAATRAGGVLCTTVFIGVLTAVNIRSVMSGAGVSNGFALIKSLSLILFAVLGLAWVATGHGIPDLVGDDTSVRGWLGALLLLMFAFGGFESALIPLAEAREPRRDAPFALMTGLAIVTVIYIVVQVTILATLPDPDATNRPLAGAARVMLGAPGAAIITLAAVLSVTGWMASNLLNVPRLTMAMAHQGDLPRVFGVIHPRFRTPWVSILLFAGVAWALANMAGLLTNLSLSAVSRLAIYGGVCAALPVFRRRDRAGRHQGEASTASFVAPWGTGLAVISVIVSVVLATQMSRREAIPLVVLVLLASLHAAWLSRRRT